MDFINTSSSAIKAQATPRRILPKRKRKETSYFPSDSESDLEGVDAEEYDSEIESAPSAKVSSYHSNIYSPAVLLDLTSSCRKPKLPLRSSHPNHYPRRRSFRSRRFQRSSRIRSTPTP